MIKSFGEFVSDGKAGMHMALKSLIATNSKLMSKLKSIHPGEVLKEDFLKPFGLSMYRLAMDIDVPPIRVSQIVNGKRAITPDTALRLAKYFQTSPEFWLNLQSHYDLENAEIELRDVLKMKVKVLAGQ